MSMNLLIDDWIPVEDHDEKNRISLKKLLTTNEDWVLSSFRDDMELATIQLLVSLVQVCFMPKDKKELEKRLNKSLTVMEYEKGIEPYKDWFDLYHREFPFMQSADVQPKKDNKNFTSLQKLFVGLPEKTSSSPSSNAFFNRVDEIETAHWGDVAVALFQQATNGFSLGGSAFSVGLKGSMPVTTLVLGDSLKKTVWLNILTDEFWRQNSIVSKTIVNEPTWVKEVIEKENTVNIGLPRGLFWQPAKMKLKIINNVISGFYTEPELCNTVGFWLHPHTPIDIIRLQNNNPKEKPYQSIQWGKPIWSQMMSFFYTSDKYKKKEGTSSAIVVQQFQKYFNNNELHLAIGGYIKGGSAEILACRKHETFSLAQGWEEQASEMEYLIDVGNRFEQALYDATKKCCKIGMPIDKKEHYYNKIVNYSKEEFYKNSEPIFHSILKKADWNDVVFFIESLKKLIVDIYKEATQTMSNDVKYFHGVIEGEKLLHKKIKEIIDGNRMQ